MTVRARFLAQPTGAGRQSGLTLIETIAALAIAAILAGTLAAALNVAVTSTLRTRRAMRHTRLAAGLERVIGRDVAALFPASESGIPAFVAVEYEPGGTADAQVLDFFTTRSLAPGGTGGRILRVEYVLRPSAAFEGYAELCRRETPYTRGKPIARDKADLEPLADGIVEWRVECYDGARWQSKWQRANAPVALRLTYSLAQGEGEPVSSVAIFAPMANPDAQALPN